METMGYDDVDGDVMGDVMGFNVVGQDAYGNVVGRRVMHRHVGHAMQLPPKPGWRHGIVAPGIHAPHEGLELLPLTPDSNNGSFDTSNIGAIIKFTAKPQRPFRAERLVAFVARVADAITGAVPPGFVLCSGQFVGTNLNQLTTGEFNVEVFGPNSFGVRQALTPAAPGIEVALSCRLNVAPTGSQAVIVSLQYLGRSLAA